MRAHTRFEEKRCGDGCSRRITSVGVFVRFFWVLLLLKYSKYTVEKSIASQPDVRFHGVIHLFHSRQRDTHTQTSKKGNLTFDLSSQLFQQWAVLAFVVSANLDRRAIIWLYITHSRQGRTQLQMFKHSFVHLLEAWKAGVITLSRRWLIEVNASPSYLASSREDYEMKFRLLEDTLNVVDMERR